MADKSTFNPLILDTFKFLVFPIIFKVASKVHLQQMVSNPSLLSLYTLSLIQKAEIDELLAFSSSQFVQIVSYP